MAKKEKFYYIDKNGDKKNYVGMIINNPDGSYSGLLTTQIIEDTNVELLYHPKIEEVKAVSAHYSYINSDGENIRYNGEIKYDGTKPYFTYTTSKEYTLIYHPAVDTCGEYYTYEINGTKNIYIGEVTFNKKTNKYEGKR